MKGSPEAAQKLIQAKGLSGLEEQKQQLWARYGCNPLALKIVSTSIQDLFAGDIAAFLAEDVTVFNLDMQQATCSTSCAISTSI